MSQGSKDSPMFGATATEQKPVTRRTLLENSRALLGALGISFEISQENILPVTTIAPKRSREGVRTEAFNRINNMRTIFGTSLLVAYYASLNPTSADIQQFGLSPEIKHMSLEQHPQEGLVFPGKTALETKEQLLRFGKGFLTLAGYQDAHMQPEHVENHLLAVVDRFLDIAQIMDVSQFAAGIAQKGQKEALLEDYGISLLSALHPAQVLVDTFSGQSGILSTLGLSATGVIAAISFAAYLSKGDIPDTFRGIGLAGAAAVITLLMRAGELGFSATKEAIATRRLPFSQK